MTQDARFHDGKEHIHASKACKTVVHLNKFSEETGSQHLQLLFADLAPNIESTASASKKTCASTIPSHNRHTTTPSRHPLPPFQLKPFEQRIEVPSHDLASSETCRIVTSLALPNRAGASVPLPKQSRTLAVRSKPAASVSEEGNPHTRTGCISRRAMVHHHDSVSQSELLLRLPQLWCP
jgi:hypothetical protein